MSLVGFIGLGNMGAHMARNLSKNGIKLIVHDTLSSATYDFKNLGAEIAKTPAEVADKAGKIITMLPSNPEVREVYVGSGGIAQNIHPDTLCIDCSTIDPAVCAEMEEALHQKRAHYIDAPVSGGVVAARDAGLTFMVGASESLFERALPLLRHMGKNVLACGKVGNGQAAKICNNMLLGISMIGVSEAMNLGKELGLDPELLAKVINSSSGRCWSSDTYNPVPGVVQGVPSSRDYEGGFGAGLIAKDLGLAQAAATARKVPIPLGSMAHQLYRVLSQNPAYVKKDFSVIYKWLSSKA